ncbi:DUF1553 domain-containing protein [Planctellipticum variicoloris]|uniref:DUF1553 domain-containing protein n=1 Tax=Planctellipticum variicoloris TaxID=3064265 RepID=UPI0030134E4F|nr:DUF1553 domain-containing protein [Planctomycetaceae bacterium SH412]
MQSSRSLLLLGVAVFSASPLAADSPVEFERDIRPLFAKRCAGCHGVGEQNGGLRLDARRLAFRGGDSGAVIVPGKAAESDLLKRVTSDDPDVRMPPDGDRLTADEIGRLTRWIEAGAVWEETDADRAAEKQNQKLNHWAWKPVEQPATPTVRHEAWPRSALDNFILARLEAAGLKPAPEADRRTLIRRLSFDLRGLPPSPEEVDAFVADADPLAYERLVDDFLASPACGERWARHWLDVVRFAESNGFETNQPRPTAWRYRDYVIRSLNEDLPYDRFVREQLVGDRLGADEATGFLVAGPWDQVKSPDPVLTAQQRADELNDMVATTGSAFLGLTVGCARCHDHKFDPIGARDYYALTACLAGVQHGERGIRPRDDAVSPEEIQQTQELLAAVERELSAFESLAHPVRTVFLDELSGAPTATSPGVDELLPRRNVEPYKPGSERGERDDLGDALRLPNLSPSYTWYQAAPQQNVVAWSPRVEGRWHVWVSWGSGFANHAQDAAYLVDRDGNLETTDDQQEMLRVDQRQFADGTGERASRRLWSGLADAGVHELTANSRIVLRNGVESIPVTADLIVLQQASNDDASGDGPYLRSAAWRGGNVERFAPIEARFVRLTITGTSSSEPCIDEWEVFTSGGVPQNVALATAGTKVTASGSLAGFAIHQLEHIHDGRYGNEASWISNQPGQGWVQYEFARPEVIDRMVWSRDRGAPAKYADRVATSYRIEASLDGEQWQVVATSDDRLPVKDAATTREVRFAAGALPAEQARQQELSVRQRELAARLRRLTDLPKAYAGRFEQPGPTFRLHRGDPMSQREAVPPGGMPAFGGDWTLAATSPEAERRQALADWIASPGNPLTARVMVNRLWHYHFGAGIVTTPSDFGINGAKPSHPELLDWLAAEFVARNWSLKDLHRLIVTSATYRQSNQTTAEGLAADAGDRLLWRFPARRLEAEPLRDAMLLVGGNLDDAMGGPGFDLFEPNTNYVKVYAPRHEFGPTEWRRMVYQSKPRMQLDDVFGAFDCPDMGQIAPKRLASTTPLQALNLLNSPFVMQQSEIFAGRLRLEAGADPEQQVERAFRLMFQRSPTAEEHRTCAEFVSSEGLELLVRVLFNSSEFLYVF